MKNIQRYGVPLVLALSITIVVISFFNYPKYRCEFDMYIYSLDIKGNEKTTNDMTMYKFFNDKVMKFTKDYNKKSNYKCTIYPIQYDCFNYKVIIDGKDQNGLNEQLSYVSNKLTQDFSENNRYIETSIQSPIIYNNIYVRNSYYYNIFFSFLASAILILFINKYLDLDNKSIYILSMVLGIINSYSLKIYPILIFSIFILYKFLKNKYDNICANFLIKLFLISITLKLIAIVVVYFINIKIYNHYMSFFQPDELFYNNTANMLVNQWKMLTFVNPIKIVKIDQYGYNVFQGIINLVNGESYFASKIINSYVSSLFIILGFMFGMDILNDKKVAICSSIFFTIMPTFIMFSVFGLRDIFISFLILIILYKVFTLKKFNWFSIISLTLMFIILFYLRRYSVIVVFISVVLYYIILVSIKLKVNIFISLLSLSALLFVSILGMKLFYNLNIISFIIDYFKSINLIYFVSGFGLSLVNLDFIVNKIGNNYGIFYYLRFFYPDTVILLGSFGLMVLGIMRLLKYNKKIIIPILIMIINFIFIYKVYYGGWFLRTQLQIMHFQVILIAIGCCEFKKFVHINEKIFNYLS